MDVAVLKIGGKAQEGSGRVNAISRQVVRDYVDAGNKVVLMPSAQGAVTDRLLQEARSHDLTDGGDLAWYLIRNGEGKAGEYFAEAIARAGRKAFLVRPWEDEFFLRGEFCCLPYDSRSMEFVQGGHANCRVDYERSAGAMEKFMQILADIDVAVFTPWAVRLDGGMGLIKGRGGSDGSLVAVTELLRRAGCDIAASTKVTDVPFIRGRDNKRIGRICSDELIAMSERQGSWPVQRYALEQLPRDGVPLGVSRFDDIDDVGTYIFGAKTNGYGGSL